ncbi:MAG: ABC transporter ATP-binding protein [Caldilineaceae bacterium]
MLEVSNVTKAFGGLLAVNAVSLWVQPGEIVGLIGPNGAGKTTLFNLISGSSAPSAGTIRFAGTDITSLPADRRCKLGIARTFQLVRIFPDLSALQNVMVGQIYGRGRASSLQQAAEQAQATLAFVGLGSRSQVEAKHLTLVDRKRLELARALATNPQLLLLDELLAGLNPSEVVTATALIRQIRERRVAILLVEHLVSAVFSLADRVVCMAFGQTIAEGTPQTVARDTAVIEAYLGDEAVLP